MLCTYIKRKGIICKACGIEKDGRGYLFMGRSGEGKSTMAKLWKGKANILEDDRIIVRKRGRDFWIYGAPWDRNLDILSPKGVKVEKIFFLKHGKENSLIPKKGEEALISFLIRCLPPPWMEEIECMIEFCSKIVESISCYELQFLPDSSVVEFLESSAIS